MKASTKKTLGILAVLAVAGFGVYHFTMRGNTSNASGRRRKLGRGNRCLCAVGQDGNGNVAYAYSDCPCTGHDTSTLVK